MATHLKYLFPLDWIGCFRFPITDIWRRLRTIIVFGLFKKKEENVEDVGPNGYYEGQILGADYAAGDSEYHDMWPHGVGKMTLTMEDGTVEVYEGSWDVGKFHGQGKVTVTGTDGSTNTTEGTWNYGELISEEI